MSVMIARQRFRTRPLSGSHIQKIAEENIPGAT
jgi:hypothetical protein